MAVSKISAKEFKKLYNNFEGTDTEFAEFLNKKFKTNLNRDAIYARRKRLGIKTKNPRKIGDVAGFKKFIQGFKGKEIYKGFISDNAEKFGIDRGTANTIINQIRPDIKDLPYKPDKETLRKETVKKKNINFLDDKNFKKELKNFKPVVTGSDAEFAEFLNKKGFKAFGGIPFTLDNVSSRRLKLGLPSKNITNRGKVFSDKDLLKEAKEMNLDIKGKTPDEIRKSVFSSRNLEIGKSSEDVKKLRDFRERKTLMAKKPRIFPVSIGKDATPKDLFWRDLIENAQRHQSYLKNRPGPILAESHIKFLNPNEARPTDTKGFKKIKLIDTNVIGKQNKPITLTYDNFLNHLDKNSKLYRIDSKTALEEYKKKRFIQKNPELRNDFNLKLNNRYDPTSARHRAVFSPFHIHHTAGRGKNVFNVQFAVGSENLSENALRRTFNKEWKAAKNFGEQRASVKKYLASVPENLEVRLNKTPYGTRETLTEVTTRVAPELSQAVTNAIKLYENAGPELKLELENRIGCSRGCFVKELNNNPQGTLQKLTSGIKNFFVPKPEMPSIKYDDTLGAFVNPATDDVVSQADLKTWTKNNPIDVKAGTSVKPGLLRKTGRALAHVGLPLPTAAMDTYFIGRQIEEGRDATEIAKDPFNWLGLATMEPLTKAAGVADKSGKLASVMRLGMSPGMIRGATRFLGLPGLAISTALTGYDQYKKYQNKEGFIYDLFNKEEIDNTSV